MSLTCVDFFTAAALIRLAGPRTWSLTVTVRQLASRSLRATLAAGHLGVMRGHCEPRPNETVVRG